MAKKPRRHPTPFVQVDRGRPKREKPKPKAVQHAQYEEFVTCHTKGCSNAIARWATGAASNGYCASCRSRSKR